MSEPRYTTQVGKRYLPDIHRWNESFEFNSSVSGGHELRVFMNLPEKHMVAAFERGWIMLGIGMIEQVIFLTFRIDGFCDMSDAPFSIHLLPSAEQLRPSLLPHGQRATLKLVLVDALTGVVRAIRMFKLSVPATAYLLESLHDQARMEFSESGYGAALASIYDRYPRPIDIWTASAVHVRHDPSAQ